jgi:hypothetical protein
MKALHKIMFILSIVNITLLTHAYEYKFKNDTDFNFLVGIQFGGDVGDPIYKKLIQKGSEGVFKSSTDFPGVKVGYCLKNVFYIKNPTEQQKTNPTESDWLKSRMVSVWGPKASISQPGEVQKFIDSLKSYNIARVAKDWSTGCGSVDARIVQDNTGNIYFAVVGTDSSTKIHIPKLKI